MGGRADESWYCASRCLTEMAGQVDEDTRRDLWRAASKYARRDAETVGSAGLLVPRAAQVVGDRSRDHK